MAYWLMKSEPDELSISGLQKLGKARWDGVRNYQARKFPASHGGRRRVLLLSLKLP
jgi:predicted RNA-binding protein with PUA-like domain